MTKKEWLLLSVCMSGFALLLSFYFYNFLPFSSGLRYLTQKNYDKAQKEFLNVLSRNPFFYPARLNLGWVTMLKKDYKNSLGEYRVVFEESSRSEDRFYSHFNSAYIHSLEENLEEALYHYQQALKERPNSMEVKKNIELLMNRVQQSQSSEKKKDQSSEDSDSSSEKKEDFKESSQNKNQKEDPVDSKNQENTSPEKTEELSSKQMEWILEELENREQKLRTRLQESQKGRKGKSW